MHARSAESLQRGWHILRRRIRKQQEVGPQRNLWLLLAVKVRMLQNV